MSSKSSRKKKLKRAVELELMAKEIRRGESSFFVTPAYWGSILDDTLSTAYYTIGSALYHLTLIRCGDSIFIETLPGVSDKNAVVKAVSLGKYPDGPVLRVTLKTKKSVFARTQTYTLFFEKKSVEGVRALEFAANAVSQKNEKSFGGVMKKVESPLPVNNEAVKELMKDLKTELDLVERFKKLNPPSDFK